MGHTTLTLMGFHHVSETLQSSNNEMVEVYQQIRDMIQVEPSKRIPLELVIEKLERIYPADSSWTSIFKKVLSVIKFFNYDLVLRAVWPSGQWRSGQRRSGHGLFVNDLQASEMATFRPVALVGFLPVACILLHHRWAYILFKRGFNRVARVVGAADFFFLFRFGPKLCDTSLILIFLFWIILNICHLDYFY